MSQPDEDQTKTAEYSGPPTSQEPPGPAAPEGQFGGQSGYGAPPDQPTPGYPAPGYPVGYPAPAYPLATPNPPYGYPGYGYPGYGYPTLRGPVRPGGATASAVLMFIQAAVVVFSTFYVLFFASLASGVNSYGGSSYNSLDTEWTIIGILQLVSVGLLIFAGVHMVSGNAKARQLTIGACGVQLAFVIYWMVRISSLPDLDVGGTTFFFVVPLMYAVLPVVALPLGLARQVSDYIAAKSAGSSPSATAV